MVIASGNRFEVQSTIQVNGKIEIEVEPSPTGNGLCFAVQVTSPGGIAKVYLAPVEFLQLLGSIWAVRHAIPIAPPA